MKLIGMETRNLNNEKVTIEELYYNKGRQEERARIVKIINKIMASERSYILMPIYGMMENLKQQIEQEKEK
jgi:hypothetical protein